MKVAFVAALQFEECLPIGVVVKEPDAAFLSDEEAAVAPAGGTAGMK